MGACGLTRALLAELLQRSTMNWARWCQPRLGPVNPELCLNVAERYRQISSIAEAMRALTLRSCHFLNQFLNQFINPGPQSGPSIGSAPRSGSNSILLPPSQEPFARRFFKGKSKTTRSLRTNSEICSGGASVSIPQNAATAGKLSLLSLPVQSSSDRLAPHDSRIGSIACVR